MSDQGYVQTILVDCNRLSSIEYNASKLSKTNNALYTNKVSDGITLDIGDKVSVESAHISQRGAGSTVIEFGGEVLGRKNISYCETVNSSYIGFGPESADSASQQSPTGYAYETSSIVTEEVEIKDNEVSIVIDYYKNANGENYITLPRNSGNWGANQQGEVYIFPYPLPTTPDGVNAPAWWEVPDGYPVGCQSDTGRNPHGICFDDFRYQVVRNFKNAGGNGHPGENGGNSTTVKLKNDNSRFTFFKKTEIVWNADKVGTPTLKEYIKPTNLSGTQPDPAIHEYIRFKEKKVISVEQGYNSPSNIASNITDELVETDNPITVNFGVLTEDGTGLNVNGTGQIVNSALHKAIPAANYETFNSSGNFRFFDAIVRTAANNNFQIMGVGASSQVNTVSSNYLSSYAFVGFKRPDLIEVGRATGTHAGYQIKKLVASGSFASGVYETDIPWTEANLTKFSKLFDTQKDLYPELLNGGVEQDIGGNTGAIRTNYKTFNTTSTSLSASFRDEARFIHIGLQQNNASTLGGDNYNSSGTINSDVNIKIDTLDLNSTPLFFYFNKNCSDLTADQTTGDRYDNLAHGWARQWTSGTDKFIAFTTELIGGVSASYFSASHAATPGQIAVGTRIGYDYHFTAYGNAAIIPSSGYFPLSYYGKQGCQSASLIRNTYVGANNPLFNFNSVENRFEISNLHTPEKVGNFFNAGAPQGFGDTLSPPPSAQGSEDCYKLNKQLNYSTWSPSMFPYPKITHTAAVGTKDAVTFIEVNENLEPGAIFDSRSGVTILDSGVDETNFERSLWGTLGFQYSQFNASSPNVLNINTRFTEDITNVSGLTTNANIISTTAVNYPQNAWGVQMFTAQINGGINYYNSSQNLNSSWVAFPASASHVIRPPSTILAKSTTIAANKLPRKLKTGYFTISSDILDQTGWYHQANPMSVLASVGKYSAENDFVEYGGGGAEFTVTRKKTITNITSQILDPEGKLAQVGDNSGIIYRIDKTINTDLNFAQSVMNGVYKK